MRPGIALYLRGMGRVAPEVSRDVRPLSSFLGALRLVPATIARLATDD